MRKVQRIVDAIANLKRALAQSGIDAPFAIEFDEAATGYRLASILAHELPMQAKDARQTGLSPQLPALFREQADIAGVKVRWPRTPARSGSDAAVE